MKAAATSSNASWQTCDGQVAVDSWTHGAMQIKRSLKKEGLLFQITKQCSNKHAAKNKSRTGWLPSVRSCMLALERAEMKASRLTLRWCRLVICINEGKRVNSTNWTACVVQLVLTNIMWFCCSSSSLPERHWQSACVYWLYPNTHTLLRCHLAIGRKQWSLTFLAIAAKRENEGTTTIISSEPVRSVCTALSTILANLIRCQLIMDSFTCQLSVTVLCPLSSRSIFTANNGQNDVYWQCVQCTAPARQATDDKHFLRGQFSCQWSFLMCPPKWCQVMRAMSHYDASKNKKICRVTSLI